MEDCTSIRLAAPVLLRTVEHAILSREQRTGAERTSVGAALESVKRLQDPLRMAWGRRRQLEDVSAHGCAIERAVLIEDQARCGIDSILVAGKVVKHSFGPYTSRQSQLKDCATMGPSAKNCCPVEVARVVKSQACHRIGSVFVGEAVDHGLRPVSSRRC